MNKIHNHWCKVCGSGYYACNDCDKQRFIAWRAVACTPEHFQAYMILHEYSGGGIDKKQAKNILETLVNLEELENYPEPSRSTIKEIFAEDTVEKPRTKSKQKKTVEAQEELHEPNKENAN